jgi:hypothetical protein
MDNTEGMRDSQGLQSSLFFETPEEIYARVFRELRPRAPLPELRVEFRRFANADSFIRLEEGRLEVRISDLLAGAPAPVMEAQAHLVRQIRGRKFISGPQGTHHNLEEIFERLNGQFFDGLLGRPQLGWSRRPSRSMLGHFDPSHNAIIISRILDQPRAPAVALEYVMFHEMLHLRYPVDHAAARRRVHTREFREAEKEFPQLKEAKEILKRL